MKSPPRQFLHRYVTAYEMVVKLASIKLLRALSASEALSVWPNSPVIQEI